MEQENHMTAPLTPQTIYVLWPSIETVNMVNITQYIHLFHVATYTLCICILLIATTEIKSIRSGYRLDLVYNIVSRYSFFFFL